MDIRATWAAYLQEEGEGNSVSTDAIVLILFLNSPFEKTLSSSLDRRQLRDLPGGSVAETP